MRKLSIEQHIRSATHKNDSLKKKSLITKRKASNIEEAVDRIKNVSTTKGSSYRNMVCKAMLIGGVAFELLDDRDAFSIRHPLEDGGGASLPKRACFGSTNIFYSIHSFLNI